MREFGDIDSSIDHYDPETHACNSFDDISEKSDDGMAQADYEAGSKEYFEVADFRTKKDDCHCGAMVKLMRASIVDVYRCSVFGPKEVRGVLQESCGCAKERDRGWRAWTLERGSEGRKSEKCE